MNIFTNDFVKPEGQRELARFGLARKCTYKKKCSLSLTVVTASLLLLLLSCPLVAEAQRET